MVAPIESKMLKTNHLLNHNNYLMSMQHQLTNALNEMKQLKPLIARSETELRNLEIKTALDFFTKGKKDLDICAQTRR